MRVYRYLVVANQTLGGEQLLSVIRDHMAAGPCHFHLLVPATAAADLSPEYLAGLAETDRPGGEAERDRRQARQQLEDEVQEPTHDDAGEDPGRRLARERLRQELARLRELGAEVSGEVGVADPIEAIELVQHRWEFDAIILSTLPGRKSRWLAMDLPTRVRRVFKLPVTHVTGPSAQTS
jgi:hypothetical protein